MSLLALALPLPHCPPDQRHAPTEDQPEPDHRRRFLRGLAASGWTHAASPLVVVAVGVVADRLAYHRAPRRNGGGFDAQGRPSRPGGFRGCWDTTLLPRSRYSAVMSDVFWDGSAEIGPIGQNRRFSGSAAEQSAARPGAAGGSSRRPPEALSPGCGTGVPVMGDDTDGQRPARQYQEGHRGTPGHHHRGRQRARSSDHRRRPGAHRPCAP